MALVPSSKSAKVSLVLLVCALLFIDPSTSVRFEAGTNSKCIGLEIQEKVLVVGSYSVLSSSLSGDDEMKASVSVTSPMGEQLHYKDNVRDGQFGFTTKESGHHMACFWAPPGQHGDNRVQIELDWKTGVAAQDYGSVAKKEKLDGLALELRKLDDNVKVIREEMTYFRQREEDIRKISTRTNSRVAWLGALTLMGCVGVTAFQVWYLKSYFERKKLL